ncbi:hypothetical protein BTJ40_12715 [Microbulbifer sp. A4B17]|uniref:hypothetical protein n=1 Tax=Microbulbifer sp. A4B17 TaxID=359370 RepID=UPI000D52D070|nr:hypothetical protein [Microbulbifer sp. A4B17]AWF81619.1 hypothetical protein BTJ40_12715 [Microbulbifer sp. A4B17]
MKKELEIGVLQELLKREEDLEGLLKIYKSGEVLLKVGALFLCVISMVFVRFLELGEIWVAVFTIPAGIMIGIAIMLGKDCERIKLISNYTAVDSAAVKERLNTMGQ